MKSIGFLFLLAAVGAGAYLGWNHVGEPRLTTYRLEKLAQKTCNRANADLRGGDSEDEAREQAGAMFLGEAKELLRATVAEESLELVVSKEDGCTLTLSEPSGPASAPLVVHRPFG